MAAAVGSGAASGSDCEGEEQEDSSSSHSGDLLEAQQALELFDFDDEQVNNGPEDELSAFRSQWQRELEATPSPKREKPVPVVQEPKPEEPLSDEDRAKQLFLRGVEMERGGKLYEAIQHYKRAIQIMPDVEARLYESTELRGDTPTEEVEAEKVSQPEVAVDSEDEDAVEGEELLTRLQRIVARKGYLCEPEVPTKGGHMSWLPYEVVQLVLRWAVSADLDAVTLERCAATCRGLYVAARDQDLWRSLCVRSWGIECGSPRAGGFPTWRHMFVERPRVLLHGCYISKTSYLRHGENSFQDQFYRPWYLVDYYRYLRFFPEGQVLSWTTAEEPAACVGHLRSRTVKGSLGIMAGHYRLIGDQTVVIMVKKSNENKSARPAPASTRFRARKPQEPEQTFHMELELRATRRRRNWQLVWQGYAVAGRRGTWTTFDMPHARFPPFAFSPVRGYTARAQRPLH